MRYFTLDEMREAIGRVTRSDIDPSYTIPGSHTVLYFPFPEGPNTPAFPAIGAFWKMTNAQGKQHVVGICRRMDKPKDDGIFPICGPAFMMGAWDAPTAERRITEAVAKLPRGLTEAQFRAEITSSVGFAIGDGPCSFWRDYNRGSRELGCKHVASAVFQVTQGGSVEDVLGAINENPTPAAPVVAGDPDHELAEVFSRVCPPERKGRRKFPVMVQGEYSGGKTVAARSFGDCGGFDAVVEAHGHAGIEAVDFLGGMLPLEGDKKLAWVDGPVTEAFRRAARGQKTLLIVDEILRVPSRERSIFLTSLSPARKKDGSNVYRLRTGRPIMPTEEGMMPTMEMVEAPETNLSIIATTNIGPGYDVEEGDPAEGSRWHRVNYSAGPAKLTAVLKEECAAIGFNKRIVAKLISFRTNVAKLRKDGEAKLVPCLRELIRALHISDDEADVPATLKAMAHTWVGLDTDGPNAAQVTAVVEAVEAAFTGRPRRTPAPVAAP